MTTPFVGDVLLVENLNLSGFPKPTIRYQWLREELNISGASGATYEVVTEDVGSDLGVQIIITNIYGSSIKVLSTNESGGVLELPSFPNEPYLDTKTFPPKEQVPIYILNDDVLGFPSPDISYQWTRSGTAIPNETSNFYVPTAVDVGFTMGVDITATNAAGSAVASCSLDEPVERADLSATYISILSPVYGGYIAETMTDAIGYDILSYNWQVNTGSNYFTFSTDPVRTSISSDYIGFPIRCILTATRSGFDDIVLTSLPVIVQQSVGPVNGSYSPQGTLIPGSGFVDSFVEKGTALIKNNDDLFASESYPVFRLGEPDVTYMSDSGMTLDMYAFHGSGVKSVTLSCNGSTSVTAGFEQEYSGTGDGYFYFNINSSNFTSGQTYEVRATATPFNGYSRSQQMILTYYGEENKVQIDTSGSIKAACLQITNAEDYDPTKKNIVELTESGYYDLGSDVSGAFPTDYGIIEVIPADGVLPKFDLTNQSVNSDGYLRPLIKQIKFNNCHFENKIGDITQNPNNSNPGIYIEDTSEFRWYADGCTFEGDWFTSGNSSLNCDQVDEYGLRTEGWWRNSYFQRLYYTNCYARETHIAPFAGTELAKNCTVEYCHMDSYTNCSCAVNCKSLKHLTPGCSLYFHADHYQLYNPSPPYLVENKILYGYYGEDLQGIMQSFGFFGAGQETYNDIAIVGSSWTGGESPAETSSQLGLTYSHLILSGLTLDRRSIIFRDRPGNAVGPVLVQDINCASLSNDFLHPLEARALEGTTNEFRVVNTDPEMYFGGSTNNEDFLTTYYQWHIQGSSMASVDRFDIYPEDPDGTNTNWLIGKTAYGPEGPKSTLDVFKSNSGRLGYWFIPGGTFANFSLSNVRDRESAEELVDQEWYMKVITDSGYMYNRSLKVRDENNICDFQSFSSGQFNGTALTTQDILNSSGITIELRSPIDVVDRARWLTDSTPSETFPVPGATLNVVLGNYEGDPTPTVSYVWKKDPLGGTNYSVISGVSGATLDLTANPLAADTSIRCDVSITNSASSETQYVDFGKVADWDTFKDGIFRFPTPLTTSYGNTIQVESSVEFAGLTQASLVDTDEDFRLKFDNIENKIYAAVWDGGAWSTYESNVPPSQEKRFSDLLGSGGPPSENEIFALYSEDPGDPSQFNDYPEEEEEEEEEEPSTPLLISGSGFKSDFDPAEETQIGSDNSVYGYHAKSIAHFTTIPYEEYRGGDYRISVMAYHCNDIDRVEFTLNGGSTISVTQRDLNPITGAYEFYVNIDSTSFSAMRFNDELLDIRAKIVPKVAGVTRSLQMKMQRPIRERTVMWVDSVNGSDDTGDGSETNPYQTISKPIIVHQANSNPSGSEQFLGACSYLTVYLKEGSYHTTFEGVSGVGYPSTQYSYLQIMGAPGTNKNLVEITSSENVRNPPTKFTKYKNLTISQNLTPTKVKQGQDLYPDEEPVLYFEGVEWVGDANADPMTFRPYLNTFDEAFMYNCNMYNIAAGPLYSTKMINTNMLNVRADSYTGCQLVVNGNVEGTTPAPGDHADVWQVACSVGEVSTGNTENNLVYNLKSIDADAQLIFLGDCESYTNTAFVNCLLARESGVYTKNPPISRIGGRINHLLLYNCCLPNQKLLIQTDGTEVEFDPDCSGACVDSEGNPIGRDPECECGGAGAYNVDIRGNIFSELDLSTNVQQNYTDGRVKIESNHFVSQTSWGTDGSTGDPEFAGVSYTPTTESTGTWYTVVYDPDEGYIAFSPTINSPVRRNFYNTQVPVDIFGVERDDPSILGPIQNAKFETISNIWQSAAGASFESMESAKSEIETAISLGNTSIDMTGRYFRISDKDAFSAINIDSQNFNVNGGYFSGAETLSWTEHSTLDGVWEATYDFGVLGVGAADPNDEQDIKIYIEDPDSEEITGVSAWPTEREGTPSQGYQLSREQSWLYYDDNDGNPNMTINVDGDGYLTSIVINDSTMRSNVNDRIIADGVDALALGFWSSANHVAVKNIDTWDNSTGTLTVTNPNVGPQGTDEFAFALYGSLSWMNESMTSGFAYDIDNNKIYYKPSYNGEPTRAGVAVTHSLFNLANGAAGISFNDCTFISTVDVPGTTPSVVDCDAAGHTSFNRVKVALTAFGIRGGIVKVDAAHMQYSFNTMLSGKDGCTITNSRFEHPEDTQSIIIQCDHTLPIDTQVAETTVTGCLFTAPVATHAQGISLYKESWYNCIIKNNIFVNCQRAFAYQNRSGADQLVSSTSRTTEGTNGFRFQNNIIWNGSYMSRESVSQGTYSFNSSASKDFAVPYGQQEVLVSNNIVGGADELIGGLDPENNDLESFFTMQLTNHVFSDVYVYGNVCNSIQAPPLGDPQTGGRALDNVPAGNLDGGELRPVLAQKRSDNYMVWGDGINHQNQAGELDYTDTSNGSFDPITLTVSGNLSTAMEDNGPVGIRYGNISMFTPPDGVSMDTHLLSFPIDWASFADPQTVPPAPSTTDDGNFEYSASVDPQVFRSFPYRTEEGYNHAADNNLLSRSPGGEGAQFFNWMFRSHHNHHIYGVHDCAVPWVSTDEGESWVKTRSKHLFGRLPFTVIESRDTPGTFFALCSDFNSNTIYGGKWKGVYKSTDYMQTWLLTHHDTAPKGNSNQGLDRFNKNVFVDDPQLLNGNRIYYYVSGEGGTIKFSRSLDNGDNWDDASIRTRPYFPAPLDGEGIDETSFIYQVAVHPVSRRVYLACENGLYYADNAHSASSVSDIIWKRNTNLPLGTCSIIFNNGDGSNRYTAYLASFNPNASWSPPSGTTTIDRGDGSIWKLHDDDVATSPSGDQFNTDDNWSKHIDLAEVPGAASDPDIWSPCHLFMSPLDNNKVWFIGGPLTGRIDSYFFDDWESPDLSNLSAQKMQRNDMGDYAFAWEKEVNGSRVQVVPSIDPSTPNACVVMFDGIIARSDDGIDFRRSMDWFKGENTTAMAFDPEDDTKIYMATEDTAIREAVCDPDGTVKYFRVTPFDTINTGWYTTKSLFWDHEENYIYTARGFASGQRKLVRLNASLNYANDDYEFKLPESYLLYNNSTLELVSGIPNHELTETNPTNNKNIPHAFNMVVKHPVTGRLASGDQISDDTIGTNWSAIPDILLPALEANEGLGYSRGKATSAEVVGMSTDGTDTYLFVVSAVETNVRRHILVSEWDGQHPDSTTFNWTVLPNAVGDGVDGADLFSGLDSSYSIVVHPTNPNVLWARIAPGGSMNKVGGDLFKYEKDGGGNWTVDFVRAPVSNVPDPFPDPDGLNLVDGDDDKVRRVIQVNQSEGLVQGDDNDYTGSDGTYLFNLIGALALDPGDGDAPSPAYPNGILYLNMLCASGDTLYRGVLNADGDVTQWEYMAADSDLPQTGLTKLWVCPITGEVFRGSCEGNYVHPPPLGYQRRDDYRTFWSRSYNIRPVYDGSDVDVPRITDRTFSDLRALISKSSGVLDLGGGTFEAEITDFDPDVDYGNPIYINASDFTEVKNGTIIAGRKASWDGPDSNGIYSANLTSDEVASFISGPRFYLYDPTLSEQPGLALYPEGPSSMTPRYTLGYHSNFLYTKAAERFTPSDSDRGYVYTHGRSFTLSTDSTYENSDFRLNDVIYLGENTNETTATAKGIVHSFRNVTSSNPTPTVHLKDLYYRDGSGEFVLDTREAGNFDESTYNAFNSGDVVTNARTDQTYTMETTTNLDSIGAQMYGFRLTHQPSIDTVNDLFTDTDNKSFSVLAKTNNNVIVSGYVTSYNQTTGIFEFDSPVSRYLGYFNFAVTGIPEVLSRVSYASYCLDPANNKMLYKPASGTPENIHIPNMRHGVMIRGKTDDDIEVPTLKLTNLKIYLGNSDTTSEGTLRQVEGPFNVTIDNCRFEYNAQAIRFSVQEDSNVHLKNSVFKDNAVRFTNGFGPGVTVERNIFDGTQASSALNPNWDGNPEELQELVVIRDNIFSLPATNHGQAISAYAASHTNILVEHNIFYNCQRPAAAQFGEYSSDPPVGGTCDFNNNLFISDGYADNVTIYQSGIAFQGGDRNVNIGNGEHKILFRSNTMFVNHETAHPDGAVIGKPCQIWQTNSAKATVSYLNNFAYGGIVPTSRDTESCENGGDGVPHNFANNFSDGFVFDPEMNSFNTAFGSTDIKLPAGLSLSDVYDVTTCAVAGPLTTGGSDGGLVGIRWNPIPTIQQINDILTNETTDWADTYPALSIPLTPGEVAYSTAFAGEDNRLDTLLPLQQPIGTTYDVKVVDIGTDDEHSRVFSIDGNIYSSLRLNSGVTYEFNQSDISNIGYGFLLSETADGTNAGGTAYTDGFSYTGTPGSDGVATFTPTSGSPSLLYYYADGESNMGGIIGIPNNFFAAVSPCDATTTTLTQTIGDTTFSWTLDGVGETGEFVDGSLWITPQSGHEITLKSVTPEPGIETVTYDGVDLNIYYNGVAINEPIGSEFNNLSDIVAYSEENDTRGLTQSYRTTDNRHSFVFVSGADIQNEIDQYFDISTFTERKTKLESGVGITLVANDSVVLNKSYLDLTDNSNLGPWTQGIPFTGTRERSPIKNAAVLSVLSSAPTEECFRPPAQWDDSDRANRPMPTLSSLDMSLVGVTQSALVHTSNTSSVWNNEHASPDISERMIPPFLWTGGGGAYAASWAIDQIAKGKKINGYGGNVVPEYNSLLNEIYKSDSSYTADERKEALYRIIQYGIDSFGVLSRLARTSSGAGQQPAVHGPWQQFAHAAFGNTLGVESVLETYISGYSALTTEQKAKIKQNFYHEDNTIRVLTTGVTNDITHFALNEAGARLGGTLDTSKFVAAITADRNTVTDESGQTDLSFSSTDGFGRLDFSSTPYRWEGSVSASPKGLNHWDLIGTNLHINISGTTHEYQVIFGTTSAGKYAVNGDSLTNSPCSIWVDRPFTVTPDANSLYTSYPFVSEDSGGYFFFKEGSVFAEDPARDVGPSVWSTGYGEVSAIAWLPPYMALRQLHHSQGVDTEDIGVLDGWIKTFVESGTSRRLIWQLKNSGRIVVGAVSAPAAWDPTSWLSHSGITTQDPYLLGGQSIVATADNQPYYSAEFEITDSINGDTQLQLDGYYEEDRTPGKFDFEVYDPRGINIDSGNGKVGFWFRRSSGAPWGSGSFTTGDEVEAFFESTGYTLEFEVNDKTYAGYNTEAGNIEDVCIVNALYGASADELIAGLTAEIGSGNTVGVGIYPYGYI